jgi:uncharacterized protein YbaR (Trm112 family)
VLADIGSAPLPFAAGAFDEIYLKDVIEHMPDTVAMMEQLYRIARPECRVFIRVVNWNSHYTAMDPTHIRGFTEKSFDFFSAKHGRFYYSGARFAVERVAYQYNALALQIIRWRPLLKFLSYYLNNILEGLYFTLRSEKEPGDDAGSASWDDFFSILRCPHCLNRGAHNPGDDPGVLVNSGEQWLICQGESCGRKYPVIEGVPVLLVEEGKRWMQTPADVLPAPQVERYPLLSTDSSGEVDVSHLYRCDKYEDMSLEEFSSLILRWLKTAKRWLAVLGLVLLGGALYLLLNRVW